MLERGVVLEHEPDVAPLRGHAGDLAPVDAHLAGIGLFESADDAQQRRLAAAGRAEQRGQLTARDVQVDTFERDEVAEPLGDAGGFDTHAECSFLRRIETTAIARTVITIRTNDN